MNEKIKLFIIAFLCGALTSVVVPALLYRRSASESADLSRRVAQLSRDLGERDKQITELQRGLKDRVGELVQYADRAGAIIERASENSRGVIQSLREAIAFIRAGIEEREDLKVELNNLRAGLYGLRDLSGTHPLEVNTNGNKNE